MLCVGEDLFLSFLGLLLDGDDHFADSFLRVEIHAAIILVEGLYKCEVSNMVFD